MKQLLIVVALASVCLVAHPARGETVDRSDRSKGDSGSATTFPFRTWVVSSRGRRPRASLTNTYRDQVFARAVRASLGLKLVKQVDYDAGGTMYGGTFQGDFAPRGDPFRYGMSISLALGSMERQDQNEFIDEPALESAFAFAFGFGAFARYQWNRVGLTATLEGATLFGHQEVEGPISLLGIPAKVGVDLYLLNRVGLQATYERVVFADIDGIYFGLTYNWASKDLQKEDPI